MGQFQNLLNQKFGRLTVIERADNSKSGYAMWICKCDCGNITKPIFSSALKSGNTNSCGCLHKDKVSSHNKTKTRIYRTWLNMKNRCYRATDIAYDNYGGRGITVCDEWLNDFQAFYDWSIANGYSDDLTIDRIDVNGNYEPSNCRWATQKEQSYNRRTTRLISYNGKTQPMKQWATELEINYNTLFNRINRQHLSIDEAFSKK